MGHLSLAGRGLRFAFSDHSVLNGADIEVTAGARVAVLGANGSGKTTLLRCLSAAIRPAAGQVLLDGYPVRYDRDGLRRHRQQVQLVAQDPDDQLFSADVARDVSFGPMNLGLPVAEVTERVAEALALMRVSELASRPTHQLSFGQRKRVAIAGALAMSPCLLLLDEPTAGLDPHGVEAMLGALNALEARRTTVVIATHDVDLALSWATDVAVVRAGGVVQGEARQLLSDRDLLATSGLRQPWVLEVIHRLNTISPPVVGDIGAHAELPRDIDSLITHLRSGS